MQARPVQSASGSDLARLTAIGNLGVSARAGGFGAVYRRSPVMILCAGSPSQPAPTSASRRPRFTLALQRLRHGTHLLHVPIQRIDQVVAHQAVVNKLAALLAANQARILENRQVFRNRRL